MNDRCGYQPLGATLDYETQEAEQPRTRKSPRYFSQLYLIVGAISFNLIALTLTWVIASRRPPSAPFGYCGTTPLEARQRGCVFDVMLPAWLPPDCYDEELTEQFLRTENFTWYEDHDMTVQLSLEAIRTGERDVVYTGSHFHVPHCKFIWMKQHRAFAGGKPMDMDCYTYEHTVHCANRLSAGEREGDVRQTRIESGYLSCILPGGKNGG